jgi:membrane protein CcdC involved in cytochrome C biogenesis
MQAQIHPVQPNWVSYAITIGIFVIVIALRLRRMGRMRRLNLGSLWIVPAIYLLIAAALFLVHPPTPFVVILSLVALGTGGVVGWMRGKMMHIHVDPESHALNQKASPMALFFLLALIVVRTGARTILGQQGGLSPGMITDPLIAFALGMLTLTRVEMYIRAKRLLEEVRARV